MKVVLKTDLDFNELRQEIDHISLFKHSMCLEHIELANIVDNKALYNIQYVVRDCHVGNSVQKTLVEHLGARD